jgi:hypothetical protein
MADKITFTNPRWYRPGHDAPDPKAPDSTITFEELDKWRKQNENAERDAQNAQNAQNAERDAQNAQNAQKAEELKTNQELQAILKQAENNPEVEKAIAKVLEEFQEAQAKLKEEQAIKDGHLTPIIKRALINLYKRLQDISSEYLTAIGNVGSSDDEHDEGGGRKYKKSSKRKSRKSRKHRKRTHRRR